MILKNLFLRNSTAILFFSCLPTLQAQTPEPTYWQDIRPVFRKYCIVCHSTKNLKEPDVSGGLALDTYDAVRKGARRAVLEPGKGKESLIVQLLVTDDKKKRMPLDAAALPDETISLIRRWIDTGAKEGKPLDIPPETVAKKSSVVRKRDIFLSTLFVPPAGLLGKGAPAKLDLGLKIGPLSPLAAVSFSPDGKFLAAGSYGQVAIWDLTAARPNKLLTNVLGAVNDVRFSPDGKLLAVAGGAPSGKGDLRIYQVPLPQSSPREKGDGDWKLLAVLRGHDDVVFSVAFHPGGKRLASASFDHTVRLWDLETFQTLQTYTGHSDFVYSVVFSPDGKRLVSASKDRTVKVLDPDNGKSIFTFSGMNEDVMALAYAPDGKSVVSSGFEAGIWWWNALTGEKIKVQAGHGVAVHELAFSKDGKRVVSAGADRTVRLWDGASGAPVKVLPVGSIAYAVAISADGKRLASGSFDGLVRLWEEPTGRHLATLLALPAENDQIDWLALTPEGYAAGSDYLLSLGQWRMGTQMVQGDKLWPTLRQPEQVVRSLRGEAVQGPKIETK